MARLILASSSPRRCALLAAAGVSFEQRRPHLDETPLPREAPAALVARLAAAKAGAVAASLPAQQAGDAVILAADTVVALDGALLGKPADRQEGLRMLAALSGRTHLVLTGFALLGGGRRVCRVVETRVTFRSISDKEIAAYWQTGEPWDKAGGYSIQGQGRRFATGMEGSCTNVMGLPMEALAPELRRFGIGCAAAAGDAGQAAPALAAGGRQ